MQLPRRLIRRVAIAVASALISTATVGTVASQPAAAEDDCVTSNDRLVVPADFAITACFKGDSVFFRNGLSQPLRLEATGDHGAPASVTLDVGPAASIVRTIDSDPFILMPGDFMRVPVGAGAAEIRIAGLAHVDYYSIAKIAAPFIPGVQVWDAVASMIVEISDALRAYLLCQDGKNWIGRAGCAAGATWDVTYAIGRAALGSMGGLVSAAMGFAEDSRYLVTQAVDIADLSSGSLVLSIAAQGSTVATEAPQTPLQPQQPQQPVTPSALAVTLTENPFVCDGALRWFGSVSGAVPGERIEFFEQSIGQLAGGNADSSGSRSIRWQCSPAEAGTTWTVTATSASARTVTFSFAGVAPAAPGTTVSQGTPPPGLTFSLTENPFVCDGGLRVFGSVGGAAPGERIEFSEPSLGQLAGGNADGNGNLSIRWQCDSSDVGITWTLRATSASGRSGAVSFSGTGAVPATAALSQTYSETVGGEAHTWTNYTNAGGTEGQVIPKGTTVQIACKLEGFPVSDGNTWWYRIAQAPWSGQFYVSADAFYNIAGMTSGSLSGTPFVDDAVPHC